MITQGPLCEIEKKTTHPPGFLAGVGFSTSLFEKHFGIRTAQAELVEAEAVFATSHPSTSSVCGMTFAAHKNLPLKPPVLPRIAIPIKRRDGRNFHLG